MLYLWLVQGGGGYDEYDGHVVCAKNKTQAIDFVARVHGQHGNFEDFQNPDDYVKLGKALKKTKPGVVLSSFNAG